MSDVPPSEDLGFSLPAVEQRYRQYMADTFGELDIPRLCEVMWRAGGRAALEGSREFTDIEASLRRIEERTRRLVGLYDFFARTEFDREVEEAAYYWKTDR